MGALKIIKRRRQRQRRRRIRGRNGTGEGLEKDTKIKKERQRKKIVIIIAWSMLHGLVVTAMTLMMMKGEHGTCFSPLRMLCKSGTSSLSSSVSGQQQSSSLFLILFLVCHLTFRNETSQKDYIFLLFKVTLSSSSSAYCCLDDSFCELH